MPRAQASARRPCDYCARFPDGPIRKDAPAGVAEVVAVARSIRRRLEDGTPSLSELARRSGVDRSTIYDLLAGRAWIDVSTLARLEAALGTRLWPSSQS